MRRLFLCVVTAIVLVTLATPAFAWTGKGKMTAKKGVTHFFVEPVSFFESEGSKGGTVQITVMAFGGKEAKDFYVSVSDDLGLPGLEYCKADSYEGLARCDFTIRDPFNAPVDISVRLASGETGSQKFVMNVSGLEVCEGGYSNCYDGYPRTEAARATDP